jgi:5'-nucleotidase
MMESLGLDIMLLGSGSIRNPQLGPIVTLQDLNEIFPYDDSIHMITVDGKQLKHMLKHMLRDEAFEGDHTEFYQLSDGLYVEYDLKTKKYNAFKFNGKEVKDDDVFKVGLQKYHYINIEDGFDITQEEAEKNAKTRIVATSCRDVLEEYMSTHQRLDRNIKENPRLVIKNRK